MTDSRGDPAVRRDVMVAAVGVLVLAGLCGLSALVALVMGLMTPAGRLGGLVGGVIGGVLACGLGLAGVRLLHFQARGANLAVRILGVLAVLGVISLFRNLRSGMFLERWPGLLGVLAGLAIVIGLIYLQHRAVQALTPATPSPGGTTPGSPPTAPPMAEPSVAAAGAPAADAGAGPVTATSPGPPGGSPYGPPAQSPYGSPGGNPHGPAGPGPYGPPAGPGGPGYQPGPRPSDPRRTVPLMLIGGGVGAALIIFAVLLVGALIWPGWLVRAPLPDEDSALSTVNVLADGIQNRDAVTLQSVICDDADPYVTSFAQRVLKDDVNLTSVEGRPTIDGTTAEAKLILRNDGTPTTWTVELAPRNARTWCVTGIHL